MLESISNFASAYALLLSLLIATVLTIVALSQRSVRLWLRDFWVKTPFIGDIARLAKDNTRGNNGWMRAEENLSAIYKKYIVLLSETKFNARIEYMRKAGDLGRTPTPLWVWFLMVILVVAEGLGFSYLLGSWMAREGSASTHTLLMFAIVLVLCIILVALTHAAGHQYHRTSLLRACFKRYKDVAGDEYSSRMVALNAEQSLDDKQPDYIQCANRVATNSHDKGSYAAGIITVITIAFIAITSTVMRWQNLEGELNRETTLKTQSMPSDPPFGNLTLPTEISDAQKTADNKAGTEAKNSTEMEGLTAFAMLGFIFVITQIVGMGAGYKYGFVGKETKGAFKDTGGFSTYDAYWVYFQPIMDLANARLTDLQQRLEQHSHQKMSLSKSFYDYLTEQQVRSDNTRSALDPSKSPPTSSNRVSASGEMPEINRLEAAKAALLAQPDKEAQKKHFLSLPSELQNELKPWLKQRKEEEAEAARQEAKAREKTELADLF